MRPALLTAATMALLVPLAYYHLPCAFEGVTHYRGSDGSGRRYLWVRLAAPFYVAGEELAHRNLIPMKRCR